MNFDLSAVLLAAQSPDLAVRQAAEQQVQDAKQTNFPMFAVLLAHELANPEKAEGGRRLAGLILKNSIDAKDEARKLALISAWMEIDPNVRNQVKTAALQTLADPSRPVRQTAAQVASRIAIIEISRSQWVECVDILLKNVTERLDSPAIRQASLETIGFICEEIVSPLVQAKSNSILTAVVQGMKDQNLEIVEAATAALYNALEFCKANFEQENERNYIMATICECTRKQNSRIRVSAYECLVRVASLYYEYLTAYMQTLFMLTLEAMKSDEDEVAKQAIEFWTTLCEEEIDLIAEADEARELGSTEETACKYYIKGAMGYLIPVLLESMTKQEEDTEDESWNAAMAAATCLSYIANTVGDLIVPEVVPFVTQHINNENWHYREAAAMAFGSILEGPRESITELVQRGLPTFIQHMKDPSLPVKDTTAWTLGRICQLHPGTISLHFPQLLQALVEGLRDETKVASNCCWAIYNLAESLETHEKETGPLSPHFEMLISVLLQTSERSDSSEDNLRLSAYETISALISTAPADCDRRFEQLLPAFLDRLDATFTLQPLGQDDRALQIELQGLICAVLQSLSRRMGGKVKPFADRMMTSYIQLFQFKNSSIHEETLLAVGCLANVMERDFEKYMIHFRPYLLLGLNSWQEYSVCQVAVGVVGDLCRALNEGMIYYTDEIVTILLQNLQNPALNRSVKPPILSCFGDIALAISGHFEKYLTIVMSMLQQASATEVDENDYELYDYLNQLREGVFEAWTGIIQGLRSDNKAALILGHAEYIVSFVEKISKEPDDNIEDTVIRGAAGVIGDLAHSLGGKVRPLLQKPAIQDFISNCLNNESSPQTKDVAAWARQVISKLQ